MKKKLIVLVLLCSAFVFSQGAPDLPSIVPATPNVAELGKYGTFPVAMNTGIPEIKFNLFEIQVNEISIPFSLSYHTGGIRVNQEATNVGLGWSIQGGGVIHRNILGVADESSLGNFNTVPYTINELVALYGGTGQTRYNNYLELKYLADGAGAMRDTQPDLFSFNMAGGSGQFIYGRDRTYLTVPYQPVKIVRDVVGSNYYFEIINESGTKYRFRNTTQVLYDENPYKNYVADWYLTDVISNNKKDTIRYEYETKAYTKITESQHQVIGRELKVNSYSISPELINSTIENSSSQFSQQELKMKRVVYNQGELVFNYNTARTDSQFLDKRLDNICVYDKNGKLIKKIEFYYNYFQTEGYSPGLFGFYRLKLTGFSEISNKQGISTKKDYAFEYNTAIEIPKVGSFAQDYWGFYNGIANNGLIPTATVIGSQIPLTKGFAADDNTTWNVGNANRSVVPNKMQMGMLKKIIYPTKGYAEFEFEPHAYISASTQAITYGGGLRVSSIKNYLANGQPAVFESYKYGVAENGVGEKLFDEALFFKNYDDTYQESVRTCSNGVGVGWEVAWRRTYLGVETYSAINYSGVPVIYKEISKYSGIDANYLNKYKFEWDLSSDPQVAWEEFINSGNYGSINQIWNQPNLKTEMHYKRNGGAFNLIQKNEYVYDNYYAKNEYGSMLKEKQKWINLLECYPLPGTGIEPTFILLKEYKYKSNAYRKKQEKSTIYYPELSTSSESITDYFYDNPTHMQLTGSKTTTSDGKTTITKTYYPDDVTSTTYLAGDALDGLEKGAIDRLKVNDLHRIAEPVQIETYKDLDNNGLAGSNELLSLQRTNYKDWGSNIVLPKDVQTLKGIYNSSTNILDERIKFIGYYTNGKVKEVSKVDGTSIYYIWGYNDQQPIAKIENFTSSQATAIQSSLLNPAITASNNDNDRTIGSSGNEGALRTALNNIRNNAALLNAMVTTYTYDPLIGVTSMTDSKGYTVYYVYDDFNRLQYIKDADGKILSKNEYHYKGQQ